MNFLTIMNYLLYFAGGEVLSIETERVCALGLKN